MRYTYKAPHAHGSCQVRYQRDTHKVRGEVAEVHTNVHLEQERHHCTLLIQPCSCYWPAVRGVAHRYGFKVHTNLGPDLVVYSELAKTAILVAPTACLEDNFEDTKPHKEAKYTHLSG